MRWAVVALLLSGCVRDPNVICDDLACPEGSTCTAVGCALPEQLDACASHADQDECTTPSFPVGSCASGVCLEVRCGDAKRIGPEVCDDGNQRSGDDCSADCLSTEVCGNGYVDTLKGEQCDNSVYGLAGDGCSSNCLLELATWSTITGAPPSARIGAVMIWDTQRDRGVLFGGRVAGEAIVNDTWELVDDSWVERTPADHPEPRLGASFAYDADHGRAVLFGGTLDALNAETWLWDGDNWEQAQPDTSPLARVGAAMAFDPKRHATVLYGGQVLGGNDPATWTWDGTTWTRHETATFPEPGNLSGQAAWDPALERVILVDRARHTWAWDGANWIDLLVMRPPTATFYAAYVASDSRGVLYFDGLNTSLFTNGAWTSGGGLLGSRTDVTLVGDLGRDRVVGFGGRDPCVISGCMQRYFADPIAYHFSWNDLSRPALPEDVAIASDQRGARAIAFGGTASGGDFPVPTDGTYLTRGGGWQTIYPVHSPDASMHPSLAETVDGVLEVGDSAATSTWIFQGDDWVERPALTPILYNTALAASPSSPRALLVGTAQDGETSETWLWDGTTWAQRDDFPGNLVAESGDIGNSRASLAFDETLGAFVAFATQQTWLWDDAAGWHAAMPAAEPPSRVGAVAVYDPIRHRVVLAGGLAPTGVRRTDAWDWDGTTWTRIDSPTVVPPVENLHGYYDVVAARVVIPDDYTFHSLAFTNALSPRDACSDHDTDGDGLSGCADPDCEQRCATCGNGTCDPLETRRLCPADCP